MAHANGRTRLDRFADFIVQYVPDAITASVVLLVVLAGMALSLGNDPGSIAVAYYKGFWSLLPFTAQMTLLILMGTAVAATPFFRWLVDHVAGLPKTANQIVVLAVVLSGAASYCFWALGLALIPIIAVQFARQADRRGIPLHFPFFMATLYAAQSVWQFGLSASAPLLVATPGHFLESLIGVVPLSRTIWSPASLIHIGVFLTAVTVTGCFFKPKGGRPLSDYPEAVRLSELTIEAPSEPKNLSERIERHRSVGLVLCAVFATWLWVHFSKNGSGLNINAMNMILLLLTFLLHGTVRNVSKALEKAVVSAWPVIFLYHLYAGLAGLIEHTRVGQEMASMMTASSSAMSFPALSVIVGSVFSFFIPSSGGQWAIQGLVTAKTAMALGVSVERGLLAMSVGDHMGNLTSPFWYVVIAAIARIDFRTFFGYGLIYAAIWFLVGTIVFTFAPC